MKKNTLIIIIFLFAVSFNTKVFSQVDFEWRLTNATFNAVDPDAAGPATGSVSFTLQIRTRLAAAMIPIQAMSTGFCWQTAKAMLPTVGTGIVCTNGVGTANSGALTPANITVSGSFPGYTFNSVNQCSGSSVNFTTGLQTFDRRAVGVLSGGVDVMITNTWTDVITVTLWSLGAINPQAGYVALNSSNGGTPGPFSNYDISNQAGDPFEANSLTYTTPLPAGGTILPVQYTKFDANCSDKGALISWATSSENNADYFEVQRSKDGVEWASVSKTKATGSLAGAEHKYQQLDLLGGAAYYRVKQVDKNGAFTYTDIKRTNCDSRATDIVIYPVPAHDVLNVVIKSDKTASTQFIIYDGTGRAVKKVNLNVVAGSNNFPVYLNGFVSGEYIIRSVDPAFNFTRKFTVLR